MVIKKWGDTLSVQSNIYFDLKNIFCGRPYISLFAHKYKTTYGWDANTISIGIRDNDDFDIGLVYKTEPCKFENILHELINWMRDHEQGTTIYDDIWNPFDFFLDCGCEREVW